MAKAVRHSSQRARRDWKPMASIGAGVQEIRIHTETEHRVCYVARFLEGIYILHAFEKRTEKTSPSSPFAADNDNGEQG